MGWAEVIVVANLFHADSRRIGDRIPYYALSIAPELCRVGMTQTEARPSGKRVLRAKTSMQRVGRALGAGETRAFMKVPVDADTSRQEADLLARIDAVAAREAAADGAMAQAMRRAAAIAHDCEQLERTRAETSRLQAAADAKMAEAIQAYQAVGNVVAAMQQATALRATFEAYVREVNPDPAVARQQLARLELAAEGPQRRL